MAGVEVNVYEVNKLDDFDNLGLIQAMVADYHENGTHPQFLISPETFDSISPATAIQTLSAFLSMFFSCKKLYFLSSLPKPLIGYIRHIFQTFICLEKQTSLIFVSSVDYPVCDFSACIDNLRARIESCKRNHERTLTKKNIVPQVHGVHLDQLREDDELFVFANFLACPDEEFLKEFNREDHHSVSYAAESDSLAYFLENYDTDIDEQRYLRYIGFVHEKAVEIMFQNDAPINLKLINHVVHTWMNACMGIIRTCDERIFNDRPPVVLPDPLPETAGDWMMQVLENYLIKVVVKNMLDVVDVKFGSMPQFLHDWDMVTEHCQILLDRAASIMPFVSFEDVIDSITDFYIHAAIAWLFVSAYQSDQSGFQGLLFVYQNLSDRVIETVMITPEARSAARHAVKRLVVYLKYTPLPSEPATYPVCVPLANPVIYASQYSQRILRQTIEYRRTTLAACQEIVRLPFVVQGESFVMPMTSAYYSSLSRVMRTDAFFALVAEARPNIGDHVVQLPSQFHFFNKPDELQHDYLVAHEKWADNRQGTPEVYTAIINTSMVEMRFRFTRTGRAAPMPSSKKRNVDGCVPEDIILQPGHLFIYRREAVRGKDNTLFSWQCRLSECLRKLEGAGVTFFQASIAVFRGGLFNQYQIDEIMSTVKLMYRGGVVKNWLYTGKQGFEKGNRRRLPYPALYSQLTNAVKENTRMRFFENWAFMQREDIQALFSQSVVMCSDDKTNEMRLITPKKNGRAYDERRGYEYRFQKMSFKRIIDHTPVIWKKQTNTSVGKTKAFCKDLYSKEEPQKLSFIYSNSPPPLRNLVGLLELKSEEFVAKTKAPGWELSFFGADIVMRLRQEQEKQ